MISARTTAILSLAGTALFYPLGCYRSHATAREEPAAEASSAGSGGRSDEYDGDRQAGDGAVRQSDGAALPITVSLLGRWIQHYEDCIWFHTFTAEGNYGIESTNGEIIVADYLLEEPPEEGERWILHVTLLYDNGLPDCKGSDLDETGMSHTVYLEFAPGGNRVDVYFDPVGNEALFSMQTERAST